MKFTGIIVLIAACCVQCIQAQQLLKGIVVSNDSVSALPFVYITNQSNGNGTMSDNEGRFSLLTSSHDTLLCSYFGYLKLKVPVSQLKAGKGGQVKIVMIPLPVELKPVQVTAFRIRPYEREYMNDIIERSTQRALDYANSPISALYMRYSREGRQVRKLAEIFENILLEEKVQKKLSREILTRLTGDDKIDYFAFRKYCYYLDDYFIISHEGAELYTRVMDCYKQYKRELNH